MSPRRDLMIDIETLGTGPDAVILSIGALMFNAFDHDTLESLAALPPCETWDLGPQRSVFHMRLAVQPQLNHGRVISADTLAFWARQGSGLSDLLDNPNGPPAYALRCLSRFVGGQEARTVWAMGPSFDCAIVEHACRQFGVDIPWGYSAHRDVRTVLDLSGLDRESIPKIGQHHNALDDAKWQVLAVQAACWRLGLGRTELSGEMSLQKAQGLLG